MTQTSKQDDSQYNFVENQDPVETVTCLIVAAAYLGLAKLCWDPLVLTKRWYLIVNVEAFFLFFAAIAIIIAMRAYISPSSLQISRYGIKYQGPYWPRRKTVNWKQVVRLYLSNELVVLLYRPDINRKRTWPLIIPSIYLGQKEKIMPAITEFSPLQPIIMTSPAPVTVFVISVCFVLVLVWLIELLITA